jgi:hypothetical protein
MVLATFDRVDKQENARQRKSGKEVPLHLLRYFPYVPVGRAIKMSELDKEL